MKVKRCWKIVIGNVKRLELFQVAVVAMQSSHDCFPLSANIAHALHLCTSCVCCQSLCFGFICISMMLCLKHASFLECPTTTSSYNVSTSFYAKTHEYFYITLFYFLYSGFFSKFHL